MFLLIPGVIKQHKPNSFTSIDKVLLLSIDDCLCVSLYDVFSRECAIKFNDYFEFPREVDMEPYTAQGLAKIEGT